MNAGLDQAHQQLRLLQLTQFALFFRGQCALIRFDQQLTGVLLHGFRRPETQELFSRGARREKVRNLID